MLSICVPHYNFPNPKLFNALLEQCLQSGLNFEILIADDASRVKNNIYLHSFVHPSVQKFFLNQNIGRSAIRNFLANKAQYGHLLFLDADAEIICENFISTYLNHLGNEIICGGRVYDQKEPDSNHLLHWTYGTRVEEHAKTNFHSNNFIIPKHIFSQVKFDDELKSYGYEDVLFGLQLQGLGYKLKHIENPVKHIQLKTNAEFLSDTEDALRNLKLIIDVKTESQITRQVRIASLYKNLHRFKLSFFLSINNQFVLRKIRSQLLNQSTKNNLKWLAVYKLYFFNSLQKKSV